MLPLKHKKSGSYQWISPQRQSSKTFSITSTKTKRQQSEIKQHLKTFNYTNERSYLIESTKKVIRPNSNESIESNTKLKATGHFWSSLLKTKKIFPNSKMDTIGQSSRTVNSSFRRKIWKSSNITPSVKFHQKITLSNYKIVQSQQKILRYKDPIPTQIQHFSINRQKIKNQWLQRTHRQSRHSRGEINNTNPQIKSIDKTFQTQNRIKTANKVQINANLSLAHHYFNLIQEESRPITAGDSNKNKLSDSMAMLEPW